MDYSKFIDMIIKQDGRNIIEKSNVKATGIPLQLVDFYSNYNPIDAEVVLENLSAVKLYPYSYLQNLQEEYQLGQEFFVFATKNSDPIAIAKEGVITFAHGGNSGTEIEVLAKTFDDYICKLMNDLKK